MPITIVFKLPLFPFMHLNWHNMMWEEFKTLSKWNFTAVPTVNELSKLNDVMPFGSLTFGTRVSQKTSSGIIRQQDWVWLRYLTLEYFTRGGCSSLTQTLKGRFGYYQAQTHGAHSFKLKRTKSWQGTPKALCISPLVGIINLTQMEIMNWK